MRTVLAVTVDSAIDDAWRPGEREYIVIRRIAGAGGIGKATSRSHGRILRIRFAVAEISVLPDVENSSSGGKAGDHGVAGADFVGLAGDDGGDPGAGFAAHQVEVILIVEFGSHARRSDGVLARHVTGFSGVIVTCAGPSLWA